MKVDKQLINKTVRIIKSQWKLFGLCCFILISLIVTLLLPGGQKSSNSNPLSQSTSQSSGQTGSGSKKKPANLLGFLFGSQKKDSSSNSANQQEDSTVKPPPNTSSSTEKSTVTQIKPDGTKTTQEITGTTIGKTTQGTVNLNANIAQDLSSNTEADKIRIVFQNPDGSTFTYIPPGTPPDEVRWGRYTNIRERYAINYPSNWQFIYSFNGKHEGVALYPPGVNANDPNSPYIGFGMTDLFLLPVAASAENSYKTSIVVDGQSGTLYTNGSFGNSYIASVMQYSGKYFGLGSSKSTATFAYIYYYMLHSLTFNIK